MTDDELTRRLRAARPAMPRRGDPLSDREEELLTRIKSGEFEATPSKPRHKAAIRRYPVYLLAASIVALVIISAMVLRPAGPHSPAYATPPLLQATPIEGSAQELLLEASKAAAQAPPQASDSVRFQFWALHVEDGVPNPEVVPQLFTIYTRADASIQMEIRELKPLGANSGTAADKSGSGKLVSRDEFGPGEYEYMLPDPPISAEAWEEYFARYSNVRPDAKAADVFNSVRLLLGERTLTPAQNASLLEYLSALPGITVDGKVTDRLGRTGVSFSAGELPVSEHRASLVVSSNGAILAFENVYLGDEIPTLTPPTVIEYAAWY